MPRKATKTAPEAAKPADQGVDSPMAGETPKTPEIKPPKKPGPAKGFGGRPTTYNPEVAEQICELLSEGIPLQEICRMEGFPKWRTVYDWMYRDPELAASIAHAREVGYDLMAEKCLQIADTPEIGIKKVYSAGAEEGEDSMTVTEEDMLGHRKLQIETRLKLLAKWNPKKYGDKITHAGDPEAPLQVNNDAMALLAAAVQNLELKRKA